MPPQEPSAESTNAANITVFVSDPTAEAERISEALRASGFQVIDVPLSMLVARVAVQRPHVVIVDVDAEDAPVTVTRMREVPDCEAIHVLLIGKPGSLPAPDDENVDDETRGFFLRPVDALSVVKKVRALSLGLSSAPPPPLEDGAPILSRGSKPPEEARAFSSRPPPFRSSIPARPLTRTSQRPPPPSVAGPLSRELESLLAEAEGRVSIYVDHDAPLPSPEEEIEAVLPEDVLAALDAPLEDDDDEEDAIQEASAPRATTSGGSRETTGARRSDDQNDFASLVPQSGDAPSMLTAADRVTSPRASSSERPLARNDQGDARTQSGNPTTEQHRAPSAPGDRALFPQHRGDLDSRAEQSSRRSSSVPAGAGATAFAPPPSLMSTTLGSEVLVQHGGMFTPGAPNAPANHEARKREPWSAPATQQPFATDSLRSGPFSANSGASLPNDFARNEPRVDHGQAPHRWDDLASSRRAPPPAPIVLGPGDAARLLAQAIVQRTTGTLTLESVKDPAPGNKASAESPETGMRRIVLHEGDVVTAASGLDSESLLAFLGARGDLPRERVSQLAGRLPPNGRHAGAALVAQGVLGQDQLWPVLRAHAEWVISHAFSIARGTAHLEPDPPGRLRSEPSVFGGSTGAEVFVEVVRRMLDSNTAMRALGGTASRIVEGQYISLLSECALEEEEETALSHARGETIAALIATNPSLDVAPMIFALSLLGIIDIVRSVSRSPQIPAAENSSGLDEDATRDRIRARLELVLEGDYFAVLGVPKNSTSYDVRRAYLDLRRTFEPSRLLTPGLMDLADDVRKIANVIEEAYEILGDGARRERYRRAIEDLPNS